jgi:hypothetical protein
LISSNSLYFVLYFTIYIAHARRFLVYIKLFSTLCGLWITEMIDWFLGQPDKLWKIFYLINNLRGLWLLIFCVILSKRVRSGLLRVSWCPKWVTTLKIKVSSLCPPFNKNRDTDEVECTVSKNANNALDASQISQIA